LKGAQAENLAKQILQSKNYQILGTNLSYSFGEVDILAQDDKTLVIVEVKFKSSPLFGRAEEMITKAKKHKLINLAQFLAKQYHMENVRIDVVAINNEDYTHYVNAVEEYGRD
jgi:putative endonuclease